MRACAGASSEFAYHHLRWEKGQDHRRKELAWKQPLTRTQLGLPAQATFWPLASETEISQCRYPRKHTPSSRSAGFYWLLAIPRFTCLKSVGWLNPARRTKFSIRC